MQRTNALLWTGLAAALVFGCGGSTSDLELITPPEDASVDGLAPDAGTGGADVSIDAPSDTIVLPEAEAGASCVATFLVPQDGATLTEKDDASGDLCKDGFQYVVKAFTNAKDGTVATLTANGTQIGASTATTGDITFSNVQLDSNGASKLVVTVGANGCTATSNVTFATSRPTNTSSPFIAASREHGLVVSRPCHMRALGPGQLFGLGTSPDGGRRPR